MTNEFTEYLKAFISLLFIVNPVGAIPVFLSLAQNQSEATNRHNIRVSAITVITVLITACVLGDEILKFLGISIPSFRVGGGILLLLMAISMMHARTEGSRHTDEEVAEATEKEGISVVPLAVPVLAGPGAISTMIIYSNRFTQWKGMLFLILSSLLVGIITWLTLSMAMPLSRLMGKTGINVVTRIMGLLLASIAVEFIAGGLLNLFPGLAAHNP
ncbi:MAG: YchE family NAAT transporter [Dissulfuribacterales bacterium]